MSTRSTVLEVRESITIRGGVWLNYQPLTRSHYLAIQFIGQFIRYVPENGLFIQTVIHVAVAYYIKQADRHQGIQLLLD